MSGSSPFDRNGHGISRVLDGLFGVGSPVLRASFVRTIGERDRIYVVRSDGSQVDWAFPSYGDALPHDLIHLVVEAAFGLAQGFWGRVDAGADPGAIMADANRRGGRDKYLGFGTDRSELQLAEVLANPGWLVGKQSTAVLREGVSGVGACGAGRSVDAANRRGARGFETPGLQVAGAPAERNGSSGIRPAGRFSDIRRALETRSRPTG